MKNRSTAIILPFIVLSACSQMINTAPPEVPPTFTAAPAIPTSTDACPAQTADADLELFINTQDGYCLLHPKEDSIIPPALIVINPTGAPGDQPGDAWAQISVEAAMGRTAAQVADQQIAEAGSGFNITRSEISLDGMPAVVVDGLPGQDASRKVFMVGNDHLYTLVFTPWAPATNEFFQLEKLYSAVMESFHLLPANP